MKKLIDQMRSSLALNTIGAIIMILALFCTIVSILGYVTFTNAFNREYSHTTSHIAYTAASLVDGDDLDAYLAGDQESDYLKTKRILDGFVERMNISLVYVIKVDTSDYGRFVSIFNSVNNTVDDSDYTPWELGYKRDTTNDEYREKYRAIYNEESDYETVYRDKTTDGQHPHITTMVPVKGSDGTVKGILCVQRPIRELTDARRPYTVNVIVTTIVLAVIFSILAAIYIRKNLAVPIAKVSDEAKRFARENQKGEKLGEISRFSSLSDLADSIDRMEEEMTRYMENLTEAIAEKERIGTELSLASAIQSDSLPDVFPAFPERRDFDLFASITAAKEVGGDLYNFFLIDDDHLALIIGDVSGKGVPAALFMMVTNILIATRSRMGGTPNEILSYINDKLCEHNKAGMFVTIWFAIIELSTGKGIAANAGHEHPAIRRANGKWELDIYRHSPAVAVMEDMIFADREFEMHPGDSLFVYTDGVTEATDSSNELFGTDRMLEALNRDPGATCEKLIANVKEGIDGFVKDAPQFDDITMLAFTYCGTQN